LSESLRWAAANRKQCCFKGLKIYQWTYYPILKIETEYTLPSKLFMNLSAKQHYGISTSYHNMKDAWLDLAQAWDKVTKFRWFRKRWKPIYELTN
jgi:hypothetical protein